MLSFRQKIFISYLAVFLLIVALIFPFAQYTVKDIAKKAMRDRCTELIARIKDAPDNESLVEALKQQKQLIFFRVSIITDENKVIYDSHVKRLLGEKFSPEFEVHHPEVNEAFATGKGYSEDYSEILDQPFAYMAKSFDFHGKTYVIRAAFPLQYVHELTRDFEFGIIASATLVLLLFSVMTWFIINYLTSPIQQIIKVIKPFEEESGAILPKPSSFLLNRSDEFGRLGRTLHSLSSKIQSHIDTLTEERNEKEAVLESLNEGVVAIDQEGKVTYVNRMAEELMQKKKEALLGERMDALEEKSYLSLLRECLGDKAPQKGELKIKRNGKAIYLDLIAVPKDEGAVLVMQDMSADHRMLEMRKEFIANASHELKTPITIIRGFAEALYDNPSFPEEQTVEITGKIVRNCEKMSRLIKDLLALADIERIPESRLIETDLYKLCLQCRDQVASIYPDAEISIDKPEGETFELVVDPNLMEMAITNLLDNAAKYSNPPAKVKARLEKTESEVMITISDNGIGIPQEDLEHIFERFYRVDKARTRKMGGSGLGLSIVQTIIEKHGGTISVKSDPGSGTTFTIALGLAA